LTLRAKVLLAQSPLAAAIVGLSLVALTHSGLADRLERLTLASAGLALLLGLLASGWLTHRILRPLAVLSFTARRLAQGDLSARARVAGSDEVAALAREVNAMAQQLGEVRRSSLGELLRAREASRAAIEALVDPVLILDAQGTPLESNAAARALLGSDLRLPETLAGAFGAGLAGQASSPRPGQILRLAAHDGERDFVPRALPLFDGQGHTSGLVLVLHDVTTERRLQGMTANLVATAAHELKTPLTSLRMALHLLADGTAGALQPKQAELISAGREDAERLQSLIEDLLEAARQRQTPQGLDLQPVEPSQLIEAALQAQRGAAQAQGVTLVAQVLPGLPQVRADRDRLTIALSNLLANAIRHSPAGGRVTVAAHAGSGALRFEVQDGGEGIPPQFQGRVFERFFRVPGSGSGGSGLGLWIVREVAEAHGGSVGLESAAGRGSRFWLAVPEASVEAPTRLHDPGARSGYSIG